MIGADEKVEPEADEKVEPGAVENVDAFTSFGFPSLISRLDGALPGLVVEVGEEGYVEYF